LVLIFTMNDGELRQLVEDERNLDIQMGVLELSKISENGEEVEDDTPIHGILLKIPAYKDHVIPMRQAVYDVLSGRLDEDEEPEKEVMDEISGIVDVVVVDILKILRECGSTGVNLFEVRNFEIFINKNGSVYQGFGSPVVEFFMQDISERLSTSL